MVDIRVGAITAAILLVFVLAAYATRLILWRKGARETRELPPELDEVMLRGEYFWELSDKLNDSLGRVKEVSEEMTIAAEQWQERYARFHASVSELSEKERDLQAKVDALSEVSLPVVEYFERAMAKEGQRSATRDYLLFFAGAIASLVISLALKWLGA